MTSTVIVDIEKMDLDSLNDRWGKLTAGFKKGELQVLYSGRQSGKSWFMQQYMTNWSWPDMKPFTLIDDSKAEVTVEVNQEIQDWLMREFEPDVMWRYAKVTSAVPPGVDRVDMRRDVYTALVLRWS